MPAADGSFYRVIVERHTPVPGKRPHVVECMRQTVEDLDVMKLQQQIYKCERKPAGSKTD